MNRFFKCFPITLVILVSKFSLGQPVYPFEKFQFDSSYRIMLMPSLEDKTNQHLCFIIDKVKDMNDMKAEWVFEKKAMRGSGYNSLSIYITRNKKIEGTFSINPTFSNIFIDGESYEFDFSVLESYARKYPLHITTKKTEFKTKVAYEKYYLAALKDPKFLFLYEPNFRYEGSFTIAVDKSDIYPDPSAAIKELDRQFLQFSPREKFNITYLLSPENMANQNAMVLEVDSDKSAFDAFKGNKTFRKGNWLPMKISVFSVWRQ